MNDDGLGEAETGLIELTQCFRVALDAMKKTDELFFTEIANLQAKHDLSGYHIICAGFYLQPSHCADLRARLARHHLIHLFDEAGGGKQRVMALIHGRSS